MAAERWKQSKHSSSDKWTNIECEYTPHLLQEKKIQDCSACTWSKPRSSKDTWDGIIASGVSKERLPLVKTLAIDCNRDSKGNNAFPGLKLWLHR